MRFFCSQPDIVEDVHTVRYHTKSSAGGGAAFLPPTSTSTRLPPSTRILNGRTKSQSNGGTVVSNGTRLTRSRTGTGIGTTMSSLVGNGSKKLFGERKGSLNVGRPATSTTAASVSISPAEISAPIPMSVPVEMAMPMGLENGTAGKMGLLHASPPPMIVSTRNLDMGDAPMLSTAPATAPALSHPIQNPPLVHPMDKLGRDMGLVTDSEREGGPGMTKQVRRKSRRMSAPLAALGINIANFGNVGSGTDTDVTMGRRKRLSKVMIGAPEGFKHEGHVGTGEGGGEGEEGGGAGFVSTPDVPELWSVEAWRAEIERTLSSAKTPPSPSRPKGPRPTSGSNPLASDTETTISNVAGPTSHANNVPAYATYLPPRNRRRGSVDGAVQRRSIDGYATERRSNEVHAGGERRSNESHGGRSNEGYGGTSGAMTDAPIGMGRSPGLPNRARSGTGGSGGSPHRRSRSGSGSQAQGQGQSQSPLQSQVNGSGSIGRSGGMGYGHSSPLGNANGSLNGHGRSQMNGLGHSHSLSQHSHAHSHSNGHGHGHTVGKGSITSLASIPTSTSASTAHTAILTPNTTSSSLGRSLSDKAYYPPHLHHHHHHTISNGSNSNGNGNGHYQQQQQYHSHLAHLAQSHHPYYHNGGAAQFGMNNLQAGGSVMTILHRSSSATAALAPSSTSSSATVASMTSTTSSLTAYAAAAGGGGNSNTHASANGYGSGTGSTTRKPIPAQRRKPVPQHLPATAEVSPFPMLLMVNGAKDAEGRRTSLPFVMDAKKEREALPDRGVDVDSAGAGAGGAGSGGSPPPVPSKVQKEMVPLLGVPGDEAHYVTKSTKARFDGAMAEIANALRDPHAEPPL